MNWFARNLVVMLFAGATSLLTAMLVIVVETRTGTAIFGVSFIRLVPLGTMFAGAIASVGLLVSAQALRLRPGMMDAVLIVLGSGFIVFMVQSAEFEVFWGGSTAAIAATQNVSSFTRFLGTAMAQSPLVGGGDDSGSEASALYFSTGGGGAAMSRVGSAGAGDSRVDGISEGVGGMMSASDPSNTQAMKHVDQIDEGITKIQNKVKNRSSVWTMLLLQVMGFAAGGLAAFAYLRTLPYCKSCSLLMAMKATKVRYFSRTREMRGAVDEVLIRARDKQLQQSILMHTAKGSEKKQNWSEYCSVMEIRRCTQCNTHRVHFHARRKDGATWKDIALMGFTHTTLEPVDFAKS